MNLFCAAIEKPFIPDGLRPAWACARSPRTGADRDRDRRAARAVLHARNQTRCARSISIVGLLIALALMLFVGTGGHSGEHFRGLLVVDHLSQLWKILLFLFTIGMIVMWFSTTASTMHEGDGPEFFTLLLSATIGMAIMVEHGEPADAVHRGGDGIAAELRAGRVPKNPSHRR